MGGLSSVKLNTHGCTPFKDHGAKTKECKKYDSVFSARDEDGTLFQAYANHSSKELFFQHPTKPYLYSKNGNRIGFICKEGNIHFGSPKGGFPKDGLKNVGVIENIYFAEKYADYKAPAR